MNKKSLINDLSFFLLLLVILTIPFGILLNSFLSILLTVATIIRNVFVTKIKKPGILFYTLIALFFICLGGLFKSEDISPVINDLERKLAFLFFPLICLSKDFLSQKKINILCLVFLAAVVLASVVTYRDGIMWGLSDESIQQRLIVHRPYIALYCVFLVFILLEFTRINRNVTFYTLLIIGYLIFFLISILAKMAIITLGISLVLYFLFILLKKNKRKLTLFLVSFIFSTLTLIYNLNPSVNKITKKIISFETFRWEDYNPQLVNSINLRFLLWECSFEIIKKNDNWVFGTGVANAQKLLDNCYSTKLGKDHFFISLSYISHNQYLTYWLNYGLLGLIIFIIHIILSLILSFKTGNPLQFIFIIIVVLSCITESVLTVQKGIVFYGIFYSLLFIAQLKTFAKLTKTYINSSMCL